MLERSGQRCDLRIDSTGIYATRAIGHVGNQEVIRRRQHQGSSLLIEEHPWAFRAKAAELVLRERVNSVARLINPAGSASNVGKA